MFFHLRPNQQPTNDGDTRALRGTRCGMAHTPHTSHLSRSRAGEPLSHGHELNELLLGEPLGLVHEPLVEQGDVGVGAAVRHDAKGQKLPEHLGRAGGGGWWHACVAHKEGGSNRQTTDGLSVAGRERAAHSSRREISAWRALLMHLVAPLCMRRTRDAYTDTQIPTYLAQAFTEGDVRL